MNSNTAKRVVELFWRWQSV